MAVSRANDPATSRQTLRLAELLAAVSLATDLADDAPFGNALGDAVTVVAFARAAGLTAEEIGDAYYLALLYHVGCTAVATAQARFAGGDDVSARHWFSEADYADPPQMLRVAATRISRDWGTRARAVAGMVTSPRGFVAESIGGICEVGAMLGARLGAGAQVIEGLDHAYARWDGKVFFALPQGEAISPIARLVHVVHVARAFGRAGGSDAADEVVRARRGSELDPELCDLWLAHGDELLQHGRQDSIWEAALGAEPEPRQFVAEAHVDAVTEALADFVDLKASLTIPHSSRVADLVAAAGAGVGLTDKEVATLRRAAQVHDLGNVSVPHRILTKKSGLDRSERERIRLHPYHTLRVLSVSDPLREIGELAGMHHERLDGTGYHRGLPAAAIPLPARVLAAAEAYQSMREERPWRTALTPELAAEELRSEVRRGQLDRRSVDAVLETAGVGGPGKRAARSWPANLTDREVDVLRTLARGRSNKEIARALHISEATVHTHLINVYGKIGVKTRAGATLFALENDLIQL